MVLSILLITLFRFMHKDMLRGNLIRMWLQSGICLIAIRQIFLYSEFDGQLIVVHELYSLL